VLNGISLAFSYRLAVGWDTRALRSVDDLLQSVRWRKAGVFDRLLAAVSAVFEGEIVMIDSTCVRVHQHGATGKREGASDASMGHS
jgi:transposase